MKKIKKKQQHITDYLHWTNLNCDASELTIVSDTELIANNAVGAEGCNFKSKHLYLIFYPRFFFFFVAFRFLFLIC